MISSARFVTLAIPLVFGSTVLAADIPRPPDANSVRGDVARMRSGTLRVKDPEKKADWAKNVKSLEMVAEWLAYRIATPPYNGEPVPREDKTPASVPRAMSDLMADAEFFTNLQPAASNMGKLTIEQVEFGLEFGKAIGKAAKVVLDNSARPIERINAVRLMAIAARMPCPDLADHFIAIIGNAKVSDGEKLYAFQGVKNLMEQTDLVDPNKHVIRDVNHLAKLAAALSAYITLDRGPRDDREKAVVEYVRRHAVAALAVFKDGVYRKPNRDLIFRPSWTLMRVIASDPSVTPPFTVQEKAEAMVGFCQMRNDPDMNLDVAAYMIAVAPVPTASGTALGGLVEFARAANADFARSKRDETLPAAPWKVLAARQSLALANWREAAKSMPKSRYPDAVITLANTGIALLAPIEKEGGIAATGTEVQAITTWATNNAPKSWSETPPKPAQLYKDDPQSIVPFAAPAAKKATDSKLATPAVPPMPMPMSPAGKGPDPKAVDPKKGTTPPAPPKKPGG
jgi:hypothetical protein